ncbi:RluA family pseudouridine synthase [Poseidonibacter ostreae]|uniref:RNA pseudouridylate synthase n=1 Tax=Poseidonibacter ostreae TaxID=2654171 RepID=A0A6L4WNW4_9BACT|nr:RluA family pseudouridine synthase [Poseidonibacter ostreae]KAB7883077.1 RNA pseudouridine synthase [Poseidonibacter ostreae]KAB7885092.1 RNA pseudouridine synthase [Poseidonibacter ostreae]KAB7888454.1 RNA pseudouridine synthase [Poseidonibacter ostreae]
MPYILKKFDVKDKKLIDDFLIEDAKLSLKLSQSLLAKGKVLDDKNRRLQKNQTIKSGFIQINIFEAITKGLKPLFQTEHFAIFDKPSGLLVHPVSINNEYTLLDEIKYHFKDDASLVHRIDKETSGLILVSKNRFSEMILKEKFENREFKKTYKVIVQGEIKNDIEINTPITNDTGSIKIKMKTDKNGKKSTTFIKPISYNESKNQTLIQAIPITGRQHQIRVHLDSINHSIVGDPIYGLEEGIANKILGKKVSQEERITLSGDKRLLLHAYSLEFEYLNTQYKFCSKQDFNL